MLMFAINTTKLKKKQAENNYLRRRITFLIINVIVETSLSVSLISGQKIKLN